VKRCSMCGEVKPLDAFHRNRVRSDGRQTVCKECKSGYNATYYAANASRHRDMRSAQRQAMREDVGAIIERAKSQPCADCGRSFPPQAMDFDHVRGHKEMDVTGMRRHGRSRVLNEIDKCDVVCATCHRRRTQRRRLRGKTAASYGWVPRGSNPKPAA
jgi:hypothetical protein